MHYQGSCPLYQLESTENLSTSTDIYIVTYSEAPGICKNMLSDKAQKRYSVKSLNEMKNELYKYFFKGKDSSLQSIEEIINNEQIAGFIGMKNRYIEFMNSEKIEIECNQDIKNVPYRFVFRFIDVSDKKINPIRCI